MSTQQNMWAHLTNTNFHPQTGLVDENSLSWREERRVYENLFKTSFDSSIIYKNMLIEMRCLLIYLRKTNQNPLQLRVNFSKYISKIFYALVFGKQFIEVNSLFDSSLFVNISILSLYPPWLGKFAFKVFDIFNHYRVSFFVKVFRFVIIDRFSQLFF